MTEPQNEQPWEIGDIDAQIEKMNNSDGALSQDIKTSLEGIENRLTEIRDQDKKSLGGKAVHAIGSGIVGIGKALSGIFIIAAGVVVGDMIKEEMHANSEGQPLDSSPDYELHQPPGSGSTEPNGGQIFEIPPELFEQTPEDNGPVPNPNKPEGMSV